MTDDGQGYLDRIQIATPCSAKWEEMEGDDRSRFCNLCSLSVYNISDMTTKEAESFLADRLHRGERVCGNLFRRQDGTILTDDCPVALRKLRDAARLMRRKVASLLALCFSFIVPARAQQPEDTHPIRGDIMVQPPVKRPAFVPAKGQILMGEMEVGKIAQPPVKPPSTDGAGGVPVRHTPPVSLNVKGSLISHSTAFYANQRAINTTAIRAVSSASLDSKNNERELEAALAKYQQSTGAARRACLINKDCEQSRKVHALEASISLTAEGNCLYYLGRANEAAAKFEDALRQLEDISFDSKPALVNKIFGNLNQAKRLAKENLDTAALKEKRGTISVTYSERGPAAGGLAWLGSDDGMCEFTDPLI
ncbi:MAG: hypothetical protein K2W95_25975 [Candidatus Obscuribacterales bacterium]|nr:hypothetical protein [Candidatus Obscuribacterales bacterium]